MPKIRYTFALLIALIMTTSVIAQQTGTLVFRANGEDFVKEGFISKDGWRIDFESVFINLEVVRAYQTMPPYDAFAGELVSSQAMVGLAGAVTVDLTQDANATTLGAFMDAPAGYYNALSWRIAPARSGIIEGASLVMTGTASRDEANITFTLRIEDSYAYSCGAFIGDERKGVLQAGAEADMELTFHFDHIFGDVELDADDALNLTAVGFDPFANLAEQGMVNLRLDELATLDADAYQMFIDIMPSLGHVGEGHCHAH